MTIEDFLQKLNLTGITEDFSKSTASEKYVLEQNKIGENSYQLAIKIFYNYDWNLNNQYFIFAEVHKLSDNIFHFSRNILSSSDKYVLGDNFQESLNPKLPTTITFNDITYTRKEFGFDFFYMNDELTDNEYMKISKTYNIIKIRCTMIGGIYVPSKKGKRYFIVSEGIIYPEGLHKPIHYNVFRNTQNIFQLTPNDIMILASSKYLTRRGSKVPKNLSLEDLRAVYAEKMTNKLLKLE